MDVMEEQAGAVPEKHYPQGKTQFGIKPSLYRFFILLFCRNICGDQLAQRGCIKNQIYLNNVLPPDLRSSTASMTRSAIPSSAFFK